MYIISEKTLLNGGLIQYHYRKLLNDKPTVNIDINKAQRFQSLKIVDEFCALLNTVNKDITVYYIVQKVGKDKNGELITLYWER